MLLATAAISLCSVGTCGTGVTPDEARLIAKEAFIFSYPLALHYRTMYVQAIDSKTKEYVGGFGVYRHYGLATPDNKDIVAPSNNTPYSWAHLDLRTEPWVLTLPKTDGRYFVAQWDDLWGFVLDNPGAVLDGNGGGNYLLVSPMWNGTVPKGIKRVVRGESDFLGTLTRTGLKDASDLPNMQKIQQGYKLQPLSSFLGKPVPAAAPEINWPAWVPEVEKTIDIFRYVNFLLPYTTPNDMDKPVLDRMAKIGIAPGQPWEPTKMEPAIRKAIEDGVADGLKAANDAITKAPASTKLFGNRQQMETEYLKRTVGVMIGQWGNVPQQAVYKMWTIDSDGKPLDASKNNYALTFEPGQVPKAKFFWSLTLYNLPERLLVENPIKRYSLGSLNKELQKSKDGSLTIYVQKDSPGKDKDSNWLPAPNGPFYPVLRVFGPGKEEQTGQWKLPPLKRIE